MTRVITTLGPHGLREGDRISTRVPDSRRWPRFCAWVRRRP